MGISVPQDYREAARLYLLAAEQGLAEAQVNLALASRDGLFGVQQDYVQAYMWFSILTTANDAEISAKAASARDILAGQMKPEQLAEAERLAAQWKLKHTAKNIAPMVPRF